MSARCIDCGRKIAEPPLCARCAPRIVETLSRLRPSKRNSYSREARPTPPITLSTVRFLQGR